MEKKKSAFNKRFEKLRPIDMRRAILNALLQHPHKFSVETISTLQLPTIVWEIGGVEYILSEDGLFYDVEMNLHLLDGATTAAVAVKINPKWCETLSSLGLILRWPQYEMFVHKYKQTKRYYCWSSFVNIPKNKYWVMWGWLKRNRKNPRVMSTELLTKQVRRENILSCYSGDQIICLNEQDLAGNCSLEEAYKAIAMTPHKRDRYGCLDHQRPDMPDLWEFFYGYKEELPVETFPAKVFKALGCEMVIQESDGIWGFAAPRQQYKKYVKLPGSEVGLWAPKEPGQWVEEERLSEYTSYLDDLDI